MWDFLKSFFFNKKNHSVLGVDISSTAVKIVEVLAKNDQFEIISYGQMSLPENSVDGHIIKDTDAVSLTIKKLYAQIGCKSTNAIVSVPDSVVIAKTLLINIGLNSAETEELVIFEAEKIIPYPIDEVNIDFYVLGPSLKNKALQEILVVATRTENVTHRLECLEKSGLIGSVVDVDSFAIERIVRLTADELPEAGKDKIIAMFDLGVVFSNLYVLRDLKIIFNREEEFGGEHLLNTIMQYYQISMEEAHQLVNNPANKSDYIDSVLDPFIETLLVHIKRSLQFFYSTSQYSYIDHIVLTGGLACVPNIIEKISSGTGISASIITPFKHCKNYSPSATDASDYSDAAYVLCCGLASRVISK